MLKKLVAAAHGSSHKTKVVLSVGESACHSSYYQLSYCNTTGGWGGCEHYSAAMSISDHRQTFVEALSCAINTYDLDGAPHLIPVQLSPRLIFSFFLLRPTGIDIDWEYPNDPGAGQPYSSSDSANLLLFFQSLRSKLGSSKIISAAVTQLPWLGSDGKPLTNVSAYAKEMNYINIM
jgi:chitinase